MKKRLLIDLLFFLFALALADRLLYYSLVKLEGLTYRTSGYRDLLTEYLGKRNYDGLIFGTSRAYEGIHPRILKDELGLGFLKVSYQGKGPRYFYHFYKLYRSIAGPPRFLIYGVDYFIYTVRSSPRWLAQVEDKAEPSMPGPLRHISFLLHYKKDLDLMQNNLLDSVGNHFHSEDMEKWVKEMDRLQAYLGGDVSDEKLITSTGRNKKYHRQLYPKYPGTEGGYLDRLLELLEKDNVTVLLVGIPDYYGTFRTNIERKDFVTDLRRMESEHRNIHLINLNRPSRFPLEETEYFIDGGYGMTNSHLSRKGAERFNRLLAEEIRNIVP